MFEYKKYINYISILFICFFIFKIINNVEIIKNIKFLISMLSPFIFAFFIAYILNPVMCYLEKVLAMKTCYTLLSIYLFVIGTIILFITIVSPKIGENIG